MSTCKLSHHRGANCHVAINSDGTIDFISYTTLVIRAIPAKDFTASEVTEIIEPVSVGTEGDIYYLTCTGTYSATTRKQIGWFLKEYFGDVYYNHMKDIAGENTVVRARRQHAKFW